MNKQYANLLKQTLEHGSVLETRNSKVFRNIDTDPIRFDSTPLVTVRKTAVKMALLEMEWFLSGDATCPAKLLPWWEKQLNNEGAYDFGYSDQLRYSTMYDNPEYFDQIKHILYSLRHHPNSRRHIMTVWNAGEMAHITKINDNRNTPTTCHTTLVQWFVRDDELWCNHYQRSADLLLGLPHNWIQHWALLLYFAYHAGLQPGQIKWQLGDAHIYHEESHIQAAREIIVGAEDVELPVLTYEYSGGVDDALVPTFKAEDFTLVGDVPEPVCTIRPKLFE